MIRDQLPRIGIRERGISDDTLLSMYCIDANGRLRSKKAVQPQQTK
ncbi:MAG: hypothetical protein WC342_02595 [Methanoregula sp.]